MSIRIENIWFESLDHLVNMWSGSSVMKAFLEHDVLLPGGVSDMASSSRFTVF